METAWPRSRLCGPGLRNLSTRKLLQPGLQPRQVSRNFVWLGQQNGCFVRLRVLVSRILGHQFINHLAILRFNLGECADSILCVDSAAEGANDLIKKGVFNQSLHQNADVAANAFCVEAVFRPTAVCEDLARPSQALIQKAVDEPFWVASRKRRFARLSCTPRFSGECDHPRDDARLPG